ncbi:hypothetical protein HPB51_025944 [Rhipicephalus microplus]|uniref:Uncharacterized protein n=1 Tax=Rhipicephalus microplus TaxID=6941 RepID=A0A9J6EDC5_RHIMP|nr:hypothetical protein HPB51_025944 [Rhipicephalus microplus]
MRSLHRHAVTDSCRSGGQVGKGASANLTSSRRALEPPDITPCVRPLERSDGRSQREPPGRLPANVSRYGFVSVRSEEEASVATKERDKFLDSDARNARLSRALQHSSIAVFTFSRNSSLVYAVYSAFVTCAGLPRLFTPFSTERNGFFPSLSVFQYASHLLLSANRRPPTTKFVASRPAVTSPNDYSAREKPHEDSPTRVRCYFLFVHSRVASSGPCEQTASARTQLRRAKRSVQEGNARRIVILWKAQPRRARFESCTTGARTYEADLPVPYRMPLV